MLGDTATRDQDNFLLIFHYASLDLLYKLPFQRLTWHNYMLNPPNIFPPYIILSSPMHSKKPQRVISPGLRPISHAPKIPFPDRT